MQHEQKKLHIKSCLKVIDYIISNPLENKFLDIFSHSLRISQEVSNEVNKLIYPVIEIFEKGKSTNY